MSNGVHPQVWAHRGAPLGSGELPPENSLTAFRRALETGCDALEFDLHPTCDGRFVVFHDLYLDHPRLGRRAIPELTLAELREKKLEDGSEIPTLEMLAELVATRDTPLIPELKKPAFSEQRGLDPVGLLCQNLRDLDLLDRVVVQCFNRQALQQLREREPELPLLALYRHDQKVHLEDVPGQAQYLGVPMLSVFFYGEKLAAKVHDCGKRLVPWREMSVSENRELLLRLSRFGVHAVMVDDAERALIHYGRLPAPENLIDYEWQLMCQEEPVDSRRCRHPAS